MNTPKTNPDHPDHALTKEERQEIFAQYADQHHCYGFMVQAAIEGKITEKKADCSLCNQPFRPWDGLRGH
jgi:UDP-N-acetylmuramate-alanine ligase